MARPEKVRLGEILVQQKLLSEEQLHFSLVEQKRTGRKLGRIFVENGFVTEEQISGAIESEGHGTFTYFLLKGLNGEALGSDGHVTLVSLYRYMTPHVQDEAHRHSREQTPQLMPVSLGEQANLKLR